MKHFLTILLFFLYITGIAQIPRKQEIRGDINADIVIPGPGQPAISDNKIAGYYQKDGKYGFVYPKGVEQPAIYSKINFGPNGFVIKKGELYGIAGKTGDVIGNIVYDSIGTIYDRAYIVKKKDKYGIISNEGNNILSIKYDKILSANKFVSFVQGKYSPIQMVFNDQEKVFAPKIEYAALYTDLAIIKANGKFGVVNKQLVVPLEYDSIFVSSMETNGTSTRARRNTPRTSPIDRFGDFYHETLLTIQKGNKYGLAESDGTVVYAADNDAVYNQRMYKYYMVKKDNLHGIYFIASRKKTEIEFERVYADGVGYVMATKNRKAGVFDLQGKQIVGFEYDPEFIMQYRVGFRVTKNKKRGILGKNGEILVPLVYDDVDPFYESELGGLVKVKSNEKFGIINLKGEIIIPVEFEWIGEEKGYLKVVTFDKRFGLYEKTGKVIVPAEYKWITDSDTKNSNIIVLKKDDHTYNFLNKNTRQVLLKENVSDYGYIHDQDGLLNPFSATNKYLLFVKGKNGKMGLLNEMTGKLDVPMSYDEIIQRFDGERATFYSVRSGKKYGLIDEKNKPVIPLQYDAIHIDLMHPEENKSSIPAYSVVVAKGNKFGTVNLANQVLIPFKYTTLQRISYTGLYKAKAGSHYQIINSKNETISQGPFDEVANFEVVDKSDYAGSLKQQALTFYKGNMRVIDDKGRFVNSEVAMQPHNGYKTFNELKWALFKALNSQDDILLKDFAAKIAPSQHILFYLKENLLSKKSLSYTDVNSIKEKYFDDLLTFKHRYWNSDSRLRYNGASLTEVTDYTFYDDGLVRNNRSSDHAFGDTGFMEKVLRNSFKINGYWISSYFMLRNFDHFRP